MTTEGNVVSEEKLQKNMECNYVLLYEGDALIKPLQKRSEAVIENRQLRGVEANGDAFELVEVR